MTPEPNEHDDELDLILTKHFAGHLDGQLGRSGRAFEEHRRQTARWSRSVRWAVATAGGLAAAAVIALAFVPRNGSVAVKTPTTSAVVQAPDGPAAADGDGALEQVVWSRTTDLGTVLLDGETPARKILREQVREVTWTDAAGTRHVRATQPRQDVLLISLDTY